jgi:hypothetical protein
MLSLFALSNSACAATPRDAFAAFAAAAVDCVRPGAPVPRAVAGARGVHHGAGERQRAHRAAPQPGARAGERPRGGPVQVERRLHTAYTRLLWLQPFNLSSTDFQRFKPLLSNSQLVPPTPWRTRRGTIGSARKGWTPRRRGKAPTGARRPTASCRCSSRETPTDPTSGTSCGPPPRSPRWGCTRACKHLVSALIELKCDILTSAWSV